MVSIAHNAPIAPVVIYGQEVLYAARGQDARSRPAKAGIQWFMPYIPALAGMTIRQDWRSLFPPPPGILPGIPAPFVYFHYHSNASPIYNA